MKKILLILATALMSIGMWAETHIGDFKKITNAEDFTTGYYVVTGAGDSKALGNTVNSNKRIEGVNVSISNNTISNPSTDVVYYITVDETTCTFKNETNGTYMYQASTTSGKGMGFSETAADIISNGWVSDTGYEGWSFTLNGTSNNIFKWNSSNSWFANYNGAYSSSMKPVDLYKLSTPTPQRTLQSIYITGEATKLEYIEGESFDPAGLKVMGKYDKGDDTEITVGDDGWTISPDPLTLGTTSVSVTATAEDKTSDPFTVNNIVVKEFVQTYANTYTSDVDYKTDCKVKWKDVEYNALKMAKNTPATITVPAHTKNLHIHAAAWNKEGGTWTISGLTEDVTLTVVADAGVSGVSTTYNLENNPETTDYFVISTNNSEAKEITITLPKDKRGVLFGVNAELEEGTVAAPSFTPTDTEFDGSVEVSLTCETEGSAIYYTTDGSVPSNTSTLYEAPFTLTDTTTVKAIAIKGGKSSEVAEKTYTLIPVYTLAEIAEITPENQKAVLVLDKDEIVEIYAGKDGDVSGIYFQATTEKKIELYNKDYAFPKTWKVGGALSGRVIGVWANFNNQWELKIATEEIEKLTYIPGITVNVTVPEGTPACYFYGEMSNNQFVEMEKTDDTHYTIKFPKASTIGWGYKFCWESGNWSSANSDPEGDIKDEPDDDGVINVEVKAWVTAPAQKPKVDKTGITVNGRKYGFPVRMVTEVK